MASTARNEKDTKEFFDPPEVLEKKVTEVARMIKESKHFIVFTGAGISTSAGIPDFRSGLNTKLETGPGAWELRAHGKDRSAKCRTTTTTKAVPTPTHMMFVKLMQEGMLKAVISQNCDGLHRRSGLPIKGLFELHGNSNVEKCTKCKRRYLRDYRVRTSGKVSVHKTGRKCDDKLCGGDLADTIINFGENLPQKTLTTSFKHAESADICLAMGSSLTVTPAADIPETVGEKNQLVIVNLQNTPLDGLASIRVFAKCDEFTHLLMSKLALDIPEFRLQRRLFLRTKPGIGGQTKILLEQVDMEGHPFSYLRGVVFGGLVSGTCNPSKQALEFTVPPGKRGEVKVQLEFWGHYEEPPLTLTLPVTGKETTVDAGLSYDPFAREWTVQRSDEDVEATATKLQACQM